MAARLARGRGGRDHFRGRRGWRLPTEIPEEGSESRLDLFDVPQVIGDRLLWVIAAPVPVEVAGGVPDGLPARPQAEFAQGVRVVPVVRDHLVEALFHPPPQVVQRVDASLGPPPFPPFRADWLGAWRVEHGRIVFGREEAGLLFWVRFGFLGPKLGAMVTSCPQGCAKVMALTPSYQDDRPGEDEDRLRSCNVLGTRQSWAGWLDFANTTPTVRPKLMGSKGVRRPRCELTNPEYDHSFARTEGAPPLLQGAGVWARGFPGPPGFFPFPEMKKVHHGGRTYLVDAPAGAKVVRTSGGQPRLPLPTPRSWRAWKCIHTDVMKTFSEYVVLREGLVLNGKRVNTPKARPVRPCRGAKFPDDPTMMAVLNMPLFEPSEDDMQRWLDRADRRRLASSGTPTAAGGCRSRPGREPDSRAKAGQLVGCGIRIDYRNADSRVMAKIGCSPV